MKDFNIIELAEPIELDYSNAASRLLVNIAAHLSDGIDINISAWQILKLSEIGKLTEESIQIIANATGKTPQEVKTAITTATISSVKEAEVALKAAADSGTIQPAANSAEDSAAAIANYHIDAVNMKLDEINAAMLNSTINQYRMAIADIVNTETQRTLDESIVHTVLGTKTRQEAVKEAVKKMASSGITGFVDSAGRTWSPDAYATMVVRTVSHTAAVDGQRARASDYNINTFQISTKNAARPLCAPYQGLICSWVRGDSGTITDLHGKQYRYISIYDTSYGHPAGIFGINCGHSPVTFIGGVSVARYSPLSGDEFEKNNIQYQQSQQQRAEERNVRQLKTIAAAYSAAGAETAYIEAKKKVEIATQSYYAFCRANKLTPRLDRLKI